MGKCGESFVLYGDMKHVTDKMTDEQAGKLLKSILTWVHGEKPKFNDFGVEMAFIPIEQHLKRNRKKWQERAERSRKNGALGGRGKKKNLENPVGLKEPQKNQDEPEKPVNVNVNVSVNVDYTNLLSFINKTFSRSFRKINDEVKRKYRARLKEGYTKEDILRAIKNAKSNPGHMETNFLYCTPEYFARAKTLDMFSGTKPQEKKKTYGNVKDRV